MIINEEEFNRSLQSISNVILKALKINIVTGNYDILKLDDRELPKSERAKKNIFAWADEFMEERNAIENAFELHRLMYNPKYLREYFSKNNFMNVKYKRRDTDGKYKWIEMQLNKIDEEWIYLFIIDVNHRFLNELEITDHVFEEKYIDSETGFKNLNGLSAIVDKFNNRKVGILYIKLSNLQDLNKFIRQTFLTFSHGYYRISDNEFYIICNDYTKQRFNSLVDTLVSSLKHSNINFVYNKLWEDKYDSLQKILENLKNDTKGDYKWDF